MNPQVKDLMGRTLDKKFSHTWTALNYQDLEIFSEYLAELIVKEMCDVFDKRAKPDTGFYEPHEPSELIKEHFGVEE
jgi:hypothetical protein